VIRLRLSRATVDSRCARAKGPGQTAPDWRIHHRHAGSPGHNLGGHSRRAGDRRAPDSAQAGVHVPLQKTPLLKNVLSQFDQVRNAYVTTTARCPVRLKSSDVVDVGTKETSLLPGRSAAIPAPGRVRPRVQTRQRPDRHDVAGADERVDRTRMGHRFSHQDPLARSVARFDLSAPRLD
jgi:hypothetical protein